MKNSTYLSKRKKLSGLFFESALPNEYLVQLGSKKIEPILGGRKFKLFKKFIRIPAYVQKLQFVTDNANEDFQGIGIEGYATWRINPNDPIIAISTLDFFDDTDPMQKTNEDLKTICIEAARHVIANMSIENALKNKDAIAGNLIKQLSEIEKKWGIIFDQVGIEKVKIMSDKLFGNLQADYRNKIRLQAAKIQIFTDREIAKEQNTIFEKNELEKVQTQQKIDSANVDKNSSLDKQKMSKKHEAAEIEREYQEQQFNKNLEFKKEKELKKYELSQIEKELKIRLNEFQNKLLTSEKQIVTIKNAISEKELELYTLQRKVEQTYTPEELSKQLIDRLPEIFQAVKIENYSVLETSGKGKSSLPVTKILNELIFTLKNNNFKLM